MPTYKPGERLTSQVSKVNVVVVRFSDGVTELTCGGMPLVPAGQTTDMTPISDGPAIQLGKRYENAAGTVELLCVTAGVGELAADGEPLAIKAAKPLPASD